MERFLVILIASGMGTAFYFFCRWKLKEDAIKGFVRRNSILHPNSICYVRTAMAMTGYFLYFVLHHWEEPAIFIFTFAAILDGVDGLVARGAELESEWGKFLDPLCDKATYLPPLASFAWQGKISLISMAFFILIEPFGQFGARPILQRLGWAIGANKFGKWKTAICFGLVIYCALADGGLKLYGLGNYILSICIILGILSIYFKFFPLPSTEKKSPAIA